MQRRASERCGLALSLGRDAEKPLRLPEPVARYGAPRATRRGAGRSAGGTGAPPATPCRRALSTAVAGQPAGAGGACAPASWRVARRGARRTGRDLLPASQGGALATRVAPHGGFVGQPA